MKTWIIASVLLGLLVIGGFAFVSALSNDVGSQSETGAKTVETISCSNCENTCNAQTNCGQATCGAVSGKGSCGCGNR